MSTQWAAQIADAILYEGYVLYPYRASAAKNRMRWQIGLVVPRDYSEAAESDPWFTQTECLAEVERGATMSVRVRGLQVQERTIEAPFDTEGTQWRLVDSLEIDDRQLIAWDEAVVSEFVRDGLALDGAPRQWHWPWVLGSACETEDVRNEAGGLAARIVRRRLAVAGAVRVAIEPCGEMVRIHVRVENVTASGLTTLTEREAAVRRAIAGTHVVLTSERASFVSLLDPPPHAAGAAASCSNRHTFPVLVGPPGTRNVVLSSPIILYDYPAVAPESAGDLCDATEIDELLMLRVRTLTDAEKREARSTDERAARIIEQCEGASAATLSNLHGTIRHLADAQSEAELEQFLNPPGETPETASVQIGRMPVGRGSRVRLAPTRRADSLDICLRGRLATVTAVYRTLEDMPYVAVALDDDPFGDGAERYRRSLFFHPDELIPTDEGAS